MCSLAGGILGCWAVLAMMLPAGCGDPVVGAACLPGAWAGPRFECLCGSPDWPASAQCAEEECARRLVIVYRPDGTFFEDTMDFGETSFSTPFGNPPVTGTWSAGEMSIVQGYDDPLNPHEKSRRYTCEGDSLEQRHFLFERLDGDVEQALEQAAATGDWVNQVYSD